MKDNIFGTLLKRSSYASTGAFVALGCEFNPSSELSSPGYVFSREFYPLETQFKNSMEKSFVKFKFRSHLSKKVSE